MGLRFESFREELAASKPTYWHKIPIGRSWNADVKWKCIRLNALGSLFSFAYVILGYDRLTTTFHEKYICNELECERLRKVLEIPRDHMKTTCGTISFPMWCALPFTEDDEKGMRELGYGDGWIRWMKVAHNTCTRTLIASEIRPNARKMGDKIANHYEANAIFRKVFEEIIPTGNEKKSRWGQDSRIHRRLNDGVYQSEGTYDFIGADVALQSNHYERHVLDDLFGEEATKSEAVAMSLIDWFKKLPGCYDSIPGDPDRLGDSLLIGNRWGRDLNTYVRENDKTYTILSHDAEGGCCPGHPPNTPIFPEEFSMKKLKAIEQIEGAYHYSCHFRNNPTAKGATRFREETMRWFSRSKWEGGKLTPQNCANYQQLSPAMRLLSVEQLEAQSGATPRPLLMAMRHEVKRGEVIDDVVANNLDRIMILDPMHASQPGRRRNAILVLGIYSMRDKNGKPTPRRLYFLDAWAKTCSFDEWLDAAIGERIHEPGLAWKWKIHCLFGDFDNAAQQGWQQSLKEKLKIRSARFALKPIKAERSENATHQRIISMETMYLTGTFWMPRFDDEGERMKTFGEMAPEFMKEYTEYPHGSTIDLLDLAGYAPQTFTMEGRTGNRELMEAHRRQHFQTVRTMGTAGY